MLDHWDAHNVFQRTISEREGSRDFVAYDGPPGTNGTPHIGHMMQSALKDLWPRYKTMKDYRVLRKAGWDTHGLPIELTAEKELGFKTKRDIEAYGVEKYIDYCRSTVYRYRDEWIKAIKRIGRFLDTDDDYATFRKEYIETDWWVLKQAWDKGLLYQDRRIMPYCSRCGTSLSQHEVAQGYKDVTDLTIYAKFRLMAPRNSSPNGAWQTHYVDMPDGKKQPRYTDFVAWTTTPWTLLSNVALAVNPDLIYATIELESGDRYIVAEARLESLAKLFDPYKIVERRSGRDYGGTRYEPLWDDLIKRWGRERIYNCSPNEFMPPLEFGAVEVLSMSKNGYPPYQVIVDNYVTDADGTGIVHLALYGADDFRIIRNNLIPEIQNVGIDGLAIAKKFIGRDIHERLNGMIGIKLLDLDILRDLEKRGLAKGKQTLSHSYPHCYRCDTPLMYFAKSGWFLRTSALKEEMLKANETINWYPDHIKAGRFGNWLENNVDWNISRDRYWGSPIPIWECECGHQVCVGSFEELSRRLKSPVREADFDPHKPGIDALEVPCEKCGKTMKRTPEVLDCWFNAGIMPWGQYGKETFGDTGAKAQLQNDPSRFPADFICEAIDQTRGWFYTMLATSVLITTQRVAADSNPPDSVVGLETAATRFSGGLSSFKNVICTEHVSDEQGQKMSKSKGNVIDPIGLCDRFGADAVRWSFYNTNPWTARRFSEADLGEVLKQVLIPYWNSYSFFVTYARVDDWKPGRTALLINPLDRWILSRLEALKETVGNGLDSYNVLGAAEAFTGFLDELTNWYIRRSRRRFWKSENDGDKASAYQSLYAVLTEVNRMLAPFIPFVSEVVYQNLERGYNASALDSVHLVKWPEPVPARRDPVIEQQMGLVRQIVSLARSLRADNTVRVRQPLHEVVVSTSQIFDPELESMILDELNVKQIRRVENASDLFSWQAKGDMKSLGPKHGAKMKEVLATVAGLDHDAISKLLQEGKLEVDGLILLKEDLILSQKPADGYWVRSEGNVTVAVSNVIDDELTSEWLAREFIHFIQNLRRDSGLEVTDRIAIEFCGDPVLRDAIMHHIRYISGETLAESIVTTLNMDAEEVRIGERNCRVRLRSLK